MLYICILNFAQRDNSSFKRNVVGSPIYVDFFLLLTEIISIPISSKKCCETAQKHVQYQSVELMKITFSYILKRIITTQNFKHFVITTLIKKEKNKRDPNHKNTNNTEFGSIKFQKIVISNLYIFTIKDIHKPGSPLCSTNYQNH